jgi:hypothetical protein
MHTRQNLHVAVRRQADAADGAVAAAVERERERQAAAALGAVAVARLLRRRDPLRGRLGCEGQLEPVAVFLCVSLMLGGVVSRPSAAAAPSTARAPPL